MPNLLGKTTNANVDSVSLTIQPENLQNAYVNFHEDGMEVKKRKGRKVFCDLGTGKKIDGLLWSKKHGFVIANSGGRTFKITTITGDIVELTGVSLVDGNRCTYARQFSGSTPLIFIANGTQIAYTDGTTATAFIADANAPTTVSHIGMLDLRLVAANIGSNTFYYSDANDPLSWQASSNYDAESSIDDIQALYIANRQIYIIGSESIETWYNAGSEGDPLIRRLSGAFINNGISAPFAVSMIEDTITMLDNKRRVIIISGDSYEVKSGKYNRFIHELENTNDAYAVNIKMDGKIFFLLHFPQDKKSLAYDYESDCWSPWTSYVNDQDDIFNCTSYCYVDEWNKHLVGDNGDGIIYEINHDQLNDNGDPIIFDWKSGHNGWENDARLKNCKSLSVRVKRGSTTSTTFEPKMLYRKNDNNSGKWSNWKDIKLGLQGDTSIVRNLLQPGGKYNTRQHEIRCADDVDLTISSMFEDVEILK